MTYLLDIIIISTGVQLHSLFLKREFVRKDNLTKKRPTKKARGGRSSSCDHPISFLVLIRRRKHNTPHTVVSMGQDDTKEKSSSSANVTEGQDKGVDAAVDTKDETATKSAVNKRDIQDVTTDGDDHQQNDSSPKKKPRQEEEEDAVVKARKVLEMFRREFGDDDDDDAVKPAIESESGKEEKTSDPAVDQASSRFHRKPTILQDDDPCLL